MNKSLDDIQRQRQQNNNTMDQVIPMHSLPRPFYLQNSSGSNPSSKHPSHFMNNNNNNINNNQMNYQNHLNYISPFSLSMNQPTFTPSQKQNINTKQPSNSNPIINILPTIPTSTNLNSVQTINPRQISSSDLLDLNNFINSNSLENNMINNNNNNNNNDNNNKVNVNSPSPTSISSDNNTNISNSLWSYNSEVEGAIAIWLEQAMDSATTSNPTSVSNSIPTPNATKAHAAYNRSSSYSYSSSPQRARERQIRKPIVDNNTTTAYTNEPLAKRAKSLSFSYDPLLNTNSLNSLSQRRFSQSNSISSASSNSTYFSDSNSLNSSRNTSISTHSLTTPSDRFTFNTLAKPSNYYPLAYPTNNNNNITNNLNNNNNNLVDIDGLDLDFDFDELDDLDNDNEFDDLDDQEPNFNQVLIMPQDIDYQSQQQYQNSSQPKIRNLAGPKNQIITSSSSSSSSALNQTHNQIIPNIPVKSVPSASASSSSSSLQPSSSPSTISPSSKQHKGNDLEEPEDNYFLCPFKGCTKQFKRQEHLKRHQRSVHSGVKPYVCKVCDKKFSRSDNLACHIKTHKN